MSPVGCGSALCKMSFYLKQTKHHSMPSLYTAPKPWAFTQETPTTNKPEITRTAVGQTSGITRATRETLLQQERWDSLWFSHLQIFIRVEDAVRQSGAFPFQGCWWGPSRLTVPLKDCQRKEGQESSPETWET